MAQYIGITGLNRSAGGVRVPSDSEVDTPSTPVATASSTAAGTLAATTYYYRITALGDTGESLPSTEVNATTTATAEQQTITEAGSPGSGTFKVTYGGVDSVALQYNTTDVTMQAALQGMASIGSGNVTVGRTGTSTNFVWTLTFAGALGHKNVDPVTITSSTLNQGSLTVATTVPGLGGQVALTWDAETGATGYRVYRGTSADTYGGHHDVVTNSYTDLGTVALSVGGTVPTESTVVVAGGDTVIKAGVEVIVDIDDPAIRKALANHASIGQWMVTSANNKYQDPSGTVQTLPANS